MCNAPEADFEAAWNNNSPLGNLWDKAIGKKVVIDENGAVTFCHPDGHDTELDLNWKRLRSMAMPIMDEQLSRIVLDGMWKKKPVRVNLGTLMLDNNVVRFDRQSYNEMEKNEKVDMAQCEIAWGKKIALEIKKREMEKHATEGKANAGKQTF